MREIRHVLAGAAYRDQVTAWTLGKLVACAFHNPKEYPPAPRLEDYTKAQKTDIEQEMAAIRRQVIVRLSKEKAKRHGG